MKKLCMIVLVLVLTVGLLAGCRGNNSGDTSAPSTTVTPTTNQPTSNPTTQPTTDMPMPGMEDMIPGTDDTIDPSNGANQSTGDTQGRSHGMSAY